MRRSSSKCWWPLICRGWRLFSGVLHLDGEVLTKKGAGRIDGSSGGLRLYLVNTICHRCSLGVPGNGNGEKYRQRNDLSHDRFDGHQQNNCDDQRGARDPQSEGLKGFCVCCSQYLCHDDTIDAPIPLALTPCLARNSLSPS